MKVKDYKGHEISVDSDGKFSAVIGGKYTKTPSMKTLENKIDALATFEPFDAIRVRHDYTFRKGSTRSIETLRVVGVLKPVGRVTRHNRPEWSVVLKDGSTKTISASVSLYKVDEKTLAAIRASFEAEAEADKLREQADEIKAKAHKALEAFEVKMPLD